MFCFSEIAVKIEAETQPSTSSFTAKDNSLRSSEPRKRTADPSGFDPAASSRSTKAATLDQVQSPWILNQASEDFLEFFEPSSIVQSVYRKLDKVSAFWNDGRFLSISDMAIGFNDAVSLRVQVINLDDKNKELLGLNETLKKTIQKTKAKFILKSSEMDISFQEQTAKVNEYIKGEKEKLNLYEKQKEKEISRKNQEIVELKNSLMKKDQEAESSKSQLSDLELKLLEESKRAESAEGECATVKAANDRWQKKYNKLEAERDGDLESYGEIDVALSNFRKRISKRRSKSLAKKSRTRSSWSPVASTSSNLTPLKTDPPKN